MRLLVPLCCAVVLVDTIFFAALAPLLPHFIKTLGMSALAVGVLNGAYGAGIIAGAIPAALLTRRLGVRTLAVVGLGILALASALFGLAEHATSLILLRFAGGFGSAFSWIAAFSWVVAATGGARRGQRIGTLVSAAVAGAVLGPPLGSAAAAFGRPPVFLLLGVLATLLALAVINHPAPAESEHWRWQDLRSFVRPRPATGLLLITLSPLLFGALITLAPSKLASLGWGATGIGGIFLVSALLEAIAHPIAGRWSDRSGYAIPIVGSLGLSAVLLLILPAAQGAWLYAGLVAVSAVSFNLALTPGTALFSDSLDELGGRQALGFALTNVAWAGGFAAGAPLGGLLSGLGGDYLAYAPLAALCCATLLALRRIV